jgi:hypothetical protein
MLFTMKKTCDSCPFVAAHKFMLSPERVEELEAHADGGFPCHQTVDYSSWDECEDPDGHDRDRSKEVHCLGHLVLQWNEWNGFGNMAALAARMGMFKPEELPTAEAAGVFGTWQEMADAQEG